MPDETFDSLHTWHGDEVPEDSPEVQLAKAEAFNKLVPLMGLDVYREGGFAITLADGTLSRISIGQHNGVRIEMPTGEDCITMHTHPRGSIFSSIDIRNMFLREHEIQKFVHTFRCTYAFYKPANWERVNYSAREIDEHIVQTRSDVIDGAREAGQKLSAQRVEFAVIGNLSRMYGLSYRIGIHNLW